MGMDHVIPQLIDKLKNNKNLQLIHRAIKGLFVI